MMALFPNFSSSSIFRPRQFFLELGCLIAYIEFVRVYGPGTIQVSRSR